MTLAVSGVPFLQDLVGCPAIGICLVFFFYQNGVMDLGEQDQKGSVLFSSYHKKAHTISVIYGQHDVDLDQLVFFFFFLISWFKQCLSVSPLQSQSSLPFLWKEVTMYGPHLRSGELCFPLFLFFFFLTVIFNQGVLCWLCLSKCYLQKLSPFAGFSVLLNTADTGCYLTLFLQHLI